MEIWNGQNLTTDQVRSIWQDILSGHPPVDADDIETFPLLPDEDVEEPEYE